MADEWKALAAGLKRSRDRMFGLHEFTHGEQSLALISWQWCVMGIAEECNKLFVDFSLAEFYVLSGYTTLEVWKT